MKHFFTLLSASIAITAAIACGGDDDDTNTSSSSSGDVADSGTSSSSSSGAASSSSGAASSSGSTSSSSGAPGACTGATAGAAIVPETSTDPVPTPTGGTIAAGTYQLTSLIVYNGSDIVEQASIGVTLTLTDTTFVRAFNVAGGGQALSGANSGTYTVAGTTVTPVETCTDGDGDQGFGGFAGDYTVAEDGTLHLFQDPPALAVGATKVEYILTK